MKKLFALIPLLLLAGIAWWLFADRDKAAKTARPPASVPVTVAQVGRRDMPVVLDVVGRSEAYASVSLKARIDGQVAEVLFHEGSHVRAGDVLMRLDPGDFKARLLQAEANLAKSQAQLAKARTDVERYVALRGRGFVSEEKVSDTRTGESAAAAQVAADRAALELARLQLGYTAIVAPFAGVVGARLVFPGTAVKVNETVLAVVNQVQPLYVSFTVPERHLPRLRQAFAGRGLRVNVAVPGDAAHQFGAEVRFIDNSVDSGTGTIQLKAVLPNKEEKLSPGQFLDVGVVLDTVKDALVVPAQALQQGPDGHYVYVATEGKAELRKVSLDFVRAGVAVIGQGLRDGETVVSDGQLRLTPGAKLDVKAAAKPAAPAK